MSQGESPGNDLRHFIGLILLVVGALWLVTTGLCTLAFVAFVVQAYGITSGDISTIVIVTGPSAIIGGLIYAAGRWLRRTQ
jgi:hypothetical protein